MTYVTSGNKSLLTKYPDRGWPLCRIQSWLKSVRTCIDIGKKFASKNQPKIRAYVQKKTRARRCRSKHSNSNAGFGIASIMQGIFQLLNLQCQFQSQGSSLVVLCTGIGIGIAGNQGQPTKEVADKSQRTNICLVSQYQSRGLPRGKTESYNSGLDPHVELRGTQMIILPMAFFIDSNSNANSNATCIHTPASELHWN